MIYAKSFGQLYSEISLADIDSNIYDKREYTQGWDSLYYGWS